MQIKEKFSAAQSAESALERVAYLPPVVETVEIRLERGFAGSIEEVPDETWD